MATTLQSAWDAVVWLSRATVIIIAGLIAVVASGVAITFQTMGAMFRSLAEHLKKMLPSVLAILPAIVETLCLAFSIASAAYFIVAIFTSYGGDWLALGLAALIGPTPTMVLYATDQTSSNALLAGIVSIVCALVLYAIPPIFRMFALLVLFFGLMTKRLSKKKEIV